MTEGNDEPTVEVPLTTAQIALELMRARIADDVARKDYDDPNVYDRSLRQERAAFEDLQGRVEAAKGTAMPDGGLPYGVVDDD